MAKNLSISNFKYFPKALLLSLVFIGIIEAANLFFDDFTFPAPYDSLRMKVKNQLSHQKNNNYDVLIFGDCYNLNGVDASLMEKHTGLSVYNFSTHAANTIFSSYLMLKAYLDSSAKKPQFIIMNYLPESSVLTKEQVVAGNLSTFYDFIDGNAAELAKEFGLVNTVKWLIPSLKHQEFFKKRFLEFKFPERREIKGFVRSVHDDRGYYRLYGDRVYQGELFYDTTRYQQPVSQFFDQKIRAMLDLAKKYNIPVIYTMFSAPPNWYSIYAQVGMSKRYFDYFQSLQKDYPNMLYYNPHPFLDKMEFYADSTHLNWFGAATYTEFLSRILILLLSSA